jgi:hypothetical protein
MITTCSAKLPFGKLKTHNFTPGHSECLARAGPISGHFAKFGRYDDGDESRLPFFPALRNNVFPLLSFPFNLECRKL